MALRDTGEKAIDGAKSAAMAAKHATVRAPAISAPCTDLPHPTSSQIFVGIRGVEKQYLA
eukprot:765558-Hanusia_phi.AAC.1